MRYYTIDYLIEQPEFVWKYYLKTVNDVDDELDIFQDENKVIKCISEALKIIKNKCIVNNNCKCSRYIVTKDELDLNNLEYIGNYWSLGNSAFGYEAYSGTEHYIFYGLVKEKYIDWLSTICWNVNRMWEPEQFLSLNIFDTNEIIFKGEAIDNEAPILINKIDYNGNILDVNLKLKLDSIDDVNYWG